MMKIKDCERAIRSLSHTWWATEHGAGDPSQHHPSFGRFKQWAFEKGYSGYFDFRSSASADYMAELWFDDELKQNWRR